MVEARRNNAAAAAAAAGAGDSGWGAGPNSGAAAVPGLSSAVGPSHQYGDVGVLTGIDAHGVITLGGPQADGSGPQGLETGDMVHGDEVLTLRASQLSATIKALGFTPQKKHGSASGQPVVAWADQIGGKSDGDTEGETGRGEGAAKAGKPSAGWAAVRKVRAASHVRLALAAAGARWAATRAKAKDLLRRVATNFWDGTEEDPAAGPQGSTSAAADAKAKGPGSYETQILENSIQKIGALLAVGFGDAGERGVQRHVMHVMHAVLVLGHVFVCRSPAVLHLQMCLAPAHLQLIVLLLVLWVQQSQQMAVPDTCAAFYFACTQTGAEVIAENIRREGDINPMVPGAKTVAVFGFCDIRRFTDATEVLQVCAAGHAPGHRPSSSKLCSSACRQCGCEHGPRTSGTAQFTPQGPGTSMDPAGLSTNMTAGMQSNLHPACHIT